MTWLKKFFHFNSHIFFFLTKRLVIRSAFPMLISRSYHRLPQVTTGYHRLPQYLFPILMIHYIELSRCRPIVRMKFGHFSNVMLDLCTNLNVLDHLMLELARYSNLLMLAHPYQNGNLISEIFLIF